ncbi:hypothetical protein AK812_SmicGene15076 [Symbiodinium microadriaticum]|uniref:Endonuclease/exonuclease/phosphatase domain-containing protein n=1 Tax=Symbiodinium microadriaticum TaxID=2951 RepID=A0A1Q9E3Z9_SYMMI|nr:hypothetical protein AK812_SmicGene15076 [Symbiodinium microadriaticum]
MSVNVGLCAFEGSEDSAAEAVAVEIADCPKRPLWRAPSARAPTVARAKCPNSPPWHRHARQRRSRAKLRVRLAKSAGRSAPAKDLRLLAAHHGHTVLRKPQMGGKKAWHGGNQGSQQYGSWGYWRGSWKSSSPRSSFPAYDQTRRDSWQGNGNDMEAPEPPSFTQALQGSLNSTRKTEQKVLNLQNGLEKRQQLWELYLRDMKEALKREQARFMRDMEKMRADLDLALQNQDGARAELIRVAALAGRAPEAPAPDTRIDRIFDVWQAETSADDAQAVLRRAMESSAGHLAGPPGVARAAGPQIPNADAEMVDAARPSETTMPPAPAMSTDPAGLPVPTFIEDDDELSAPPDPGGQGFLFFGSSTFFLPREVIYLLVSKPFAAQLPCSVVLPAPTGLRNSIAETHATSPPVSSAEAVNNIEPEVSFVVVPSWFTAAKLVPVLIDARACDGGVFATVVPYPTDAAGISRAAGFSAAGPCDFFVSGCFTRIEPDESVELPEGALIKILPPNSVPLWAPILVFSLWHPCMWTTPSPEVVTGASYCVQLLHSSGKYLLSHREEDQWRHLNRVAQLIGVLLAEVRVIYADTTSFHPYVHRGVLVRGVVAVYPRTTDKDEEGHPLPYVVFVDGRLIGASFEILTLPSKYVSIHTIQQHFSIPALQGWRLAVRGGHICDQGYEVQHGEVLTLALIQEGAPGDEDPESESNFSEDPEAEDPDPESATTALVAAVVALEGQQLAHHLPEPFHRIGDTPPRTATDDTEEVDTEGIEAEAPPSDVWTPTFVVFLYNTSPVVVKVTLEAPCELEQALRTVSGSFPHEYGQFYSRFTHADPQPSEHWGALLALPRWSQREPLVLLNLVHFDGRCFLAALPDPFTKAHVLQVAALSHDTALDVFVFRSHMPSAPNELHNLVEGGTITIKREGGPYITQGFSIWTMLASPHLWDNEPVLPSPPADRKACVVQESMYGFVAVSEESNSLAEHVHVAYRLTQQRTHFSISRTQPEDVLCSGFPCSILCAFVLADPLQQPGENCLVILDCRPLLMGWTNWSTVEPEVPHQTLVDVFDTFAPPGWKPVFTGVPCIEGKLQCYDGCVLVGAYIRTNPLAPLYPVIVPTTPEGSDDDQDGDTTSHSSDPSEAGGSGSPAHQTLLLNTTPEPAHYRSRSRSPRRHPTEVHTYPVCFPCIWDMLVVALVIKGCFVALLPYLLGNHGHTLAVLCVISWMAAPVEAFASTPALIIAPDATVLSLSRHVQLLVWCMLLVRPYVSLLQQLPSTLMTAKACKILREPCPGTPSHAQRLEELRSITVRLGFPWPFGFLGGPALGPQNAEEEHQDSPQQVATATINFAVLVPDYVPELSSTTLTIPATVHEAAESLRVVRDTASSEQFPHLCAVIPQPVEGFATFLALPQWNPTALAVCFNTLHVDSRVFSGYAPDYTDYTALVRLAGLPTQTPYDVYVATDEEPLPHDAQVHLHAGQQILYMHAGSPQPRHWDLYTALLDYLSWNSQSPFPTPLLQRAYCLASTTCHRLQVEDFETPFQFRRRFAATMGLSSDAFHIAPATPIPTNVAISGVPCRTVVALCESSRPTDAIIILDCRAIREGIRAMIVPFAHLALEHLLLELQDEAPPGWSPVILPEINHHDAIPVVSGQVLTVSYRTSPYHRGPTVVPGTHPDAGSTPATSSPGPSSSPLQATPHGVDTPLAQADAGDEGDIDDVPDAPTQSAPRDQPPVQITCVVLVPTYKPEVHTLHVHFPSTVILTCAALSAVREDLKWLHFPTLIPVYPQPDFECAFFIARPHFPTETVTVVFDTRAVDGRLFAMSLPPVVDRIFLLSATQLDHRAFVQVYHRDLPWALTDAQTVYLSDGDLICVHSVDMEVSFLVSLDDRLCDPNGWASPGCFFLEIPETFWVLAVRQRFWLPAATGGPANLRAGIANRLKVDVSDLSIVPAHMPLRDLAFSGWPACALLAAEVPDEPIVPPLAHDVFYFLDKRPLLLDIIWTAARDGTADLTAARASLETRCPQGYFIHFRGDTPSQGDRRRVFSGEVIVVEFLQANIPLTAIPVPDPGGRSPEGDQGADPTHQMSAPTGPTTTQAGTTVTADTGGTNASSSAGPVYQVSTCSTLSVLPPALSGTSREALYTSRRQPLASAARCVAVLFGIFLCLSQAPLWGLGIIFTLHGSLGGPLRLTWLIAVGCVLSGKATAMPEYTFAVTGPSSTLGSCPADVPCEGPSFRRHACSYVRPVATPCRSLPCPPAETMPVVPSTWHYTTLLESSCREAEGKPFYDACTLLEVLWQHFADSKSWPLQAGGFQCPAPRQKITLQHLIPREVDSHSAFPLLLPSRSALAWPARPPGITPADTVTIGQTPLGFTLAQLQRFFTAPAPLLNWQQAISILPLFRHEAESSWPAFRATVRSQSKPNDLWAFTDGSYTPASKHGSARAGWAVVFVDPLANAFAITLGPVLSAADPGISVNAYLAECQALTAAALVSIASFSHRRVVFVSDCTAAIDAAAGRCGYQLQGIPHTLASVRTFRKQVCGQHDAYLHVSGHSGVLGNEWADRDPTVPPVFTQAVGDNQFHAGLTRTQLLEPFLPPGALDIAQGSGVPASEVVQHLHIAAVTFNVLSLGGKADASPAEDVTQGLAFRPARAALLADQLHKHGVTVAFLQETRADTGTTRAGQYLRFIAGADRGQHGTEIWFATGQPLLQGTAPDQGKDAFETPTLVKVHQDPRRLLIRFSGKSISVLFVSLHGPHRATERAAIDQWWQHTERLLQQHARQSHVLIGGDMNASLGSITSRHVGPVAAEDEDIAGEYLHRLSKTYNLCFPSTMDQCHTDCYISELARTIATAPTKEAFAAYHRILAHRRKKAFRLEPLPGILKTDGEPCADAVEVQQRWRQQFAGLEAGLDTTFNELTQRTQAIGPSAVFEHPLDVSEVPSLPLLRRILASTKSGKASGMDSIPPELNRYFADESADLLYPLLLKFLWRGEEALGHKGGQAVILYKGRGPTDQCSSYRSILLMNTWAKAFHQSIRPAIKTVFEASAPALQLGGRAGCSVALGSHVLRSLARYAHQHSLSGYVLYADISAAFYSALVQLVAHSEATTCPEALMRAMHGLQLPAEAQAELTCALRDLGDGNWFMVAGDATPVATARGTRPGSSWADILFAFLMPRILRVRDQILAESHHEPQPPTLPWDGCKVLEPCDSDRSVVISDIIWADDIATPRLVAEAGLVEGYIRADVTAITEAFFSFGFRLSFGDHKTAAVVTLCGHRSRQVKRRLFGPKGLQGKLPVLLEHLPVMQLPLTAKYKHLGVMQAPQGSILEEIRYRAAQARSAFQEATLLVATDTVQEPSYCVHDAPSEPDRVPHNTVSLSLLNVLMQLDDCTESEVWEVIEGHIEPLATLRNTVSEWKASLPSFSTQAEIAENMLLLLDPAISAESHQPTTSKATLSENYVPAWKPLSPLPVAASGTVAFWSLEPPPPAVLSPHCPTSMSVRAADAYATWLVSACDVCAQCVRQSASQPVQLSCEGFSAGAGIVTSWLTQCGFQASVRRGPWTAALEY